MPWIWSCHKCHTRYALGATRRCLHDGHYFCGGTTVDKRTGKTKRHRACASEFDYIGWEHFNDWKREQKYLQYPNLKHCETQCDFPSACHWKARHTPKKDANFSFLNPNCLGTEESQPKSTNPSSTVPERTLSSVPKLLTRFVKAAEKRTSQLTTLLSTLEEESNFASTPGYLPPPTSTSTAQKPPTLHPLSLHIPILDFSLQTSSPHPPTPSLSIFSEAAATEEESEDTDVDMTDWIAKDDIDSPPTSPTLPPPPPPKSPLRIHPPSPTNVPFDFSINETQIAEMSADDESPISPHLTAWQWTAGAIGIALSPPIRTESMEDVDSDSEGEEVAMPWEKDIHSRISI